MKRPESKYDIVKLLLMMITIMMMLLATNLFLINENKITVMAIQEANNEEEINSSLSGLKKDFFVYMINKSITMLELSNKKDYSNNYVSFTKSLVDKVINFDYKNPKSFLGAQISMIKEVENDLQVVSKSPIDDEDYDGRNLYVTKDEKSNSLIKNNPRNQSSNNFADDIVVINKNDSEAFNESEDDNQENINMFDDIEIVSTPVPTPTKIIHDMEKPLIFIYHTHGTESYKPESIGNYHSLNRKFTVITLGEELKKGLENKGYKVIHDDTMHDYPSYEGSYSRSIQTLEKNLKNYPSLKVVIDIHRDGINNVDTLDNYEVIRKKFVTKINGEDVAKFSLVLGNANENVNELRRFMYYLKAVSDEMYPGLASEVIVKDYKYNEYKSNYYSLIEIGSNVNTIEESTKTAQYLVEVYNKALNGFVSKNN